MSARRLVSWGLLLVLLALTLLIVQHFQHRVPEESVSDASQWLLRGAGVLLALAVVLWLLEKLGFMVSGARCKDCKRKVPFNHAYCLDHIRARADAAREKYRHR